MKKITKIIYTIIVAAFLGLAKSFGYKTEFKDSQTEKKIERKK